MEIGHRPHENHVSLPYNKRSGENNDDDDENDNLDKMYLGIPNYHLGFCLLVFIPTTVMMVMMTMVMVMMVAAN